MERFPDRTEAGRRLGRLLLPWGSADPVIAALPRGGVPVGFEIARLLGAPLDVVIVRKLGVPQQPELAMGALSEDNIRVLNPEVISALRIPELVVDDVTERASLEITDRLLRLRGEREAVDVRDRAVICVDDGIATGATLRAAVEVLRLRGARQVVVAAPVGARDSVAQLRTVADDVVCLMTPERFLAIGEWYDDFRQVDDEEVRRLLDRAADVEHPRTPRVQATEGEVTVEAGGVALPGQLTLPPDARGIVLFAHGSGSSRRSPRNVAIARHLSGSGVGTLLFDLLTEAESRLREKVFDIELLASRLKGATEWARGQPGGGLPVGYFGASTGAAAALLAAASLGERIAAVVSRGGRPDLAGPHLAEVRSPVLLVVGGADTGVLELNRAAQRLLRCEHALEVVPGATHLFEEPGTLERVADLARDWFLRYLPRGAPEPSGAAAFRHDERHLA